MGYKTLFLAVLLMLAACNDRQAADMQPDAAPSFAWTDMQGGQHKLEDFAGRPVILHFWASWCAPCVDELPRLVKAAATMPDTVAVLAVSSDSDKAAALRLIDKSGRADNVFQAFDPKRKITFDLFQTALFPETILLDRDHRMVRKFAGPVDWTNAGTKAAVSTLAAR